MQMKWNIQMKKPYKRLLKQVICSRIDIQLDFKHGLDKIAVVLENMAGISPPISRMPSSTSWSRIREAVIALYDLTMKSLFHLQ
jgi:hypothetical protein